jgi:hypothetical protein
MLLFGENFKKEKGKSLVPSKLITMFYFTYFFTYFAPIRILNGHNQITLTLHGTMNIWSGNTKIPNAAQIKPEKET